MTGRTRSAVSAVACDLGSSMGTWLLRDVAVITGRPSTKLSQGIAPCAVRNVLSITVSIDNQLMLLLLQLSAER